MQQQRQSQWPEAWIDVRVAAIDVETTGFDLDEDRIIEIGIVTFEQGQPVDTWGTLVNPSRPIPPVVIELTGIDDAAVAEAPHFEDIAAEVARRLEGVAICAYNLRFDRRFITAELERYGQTWPEGAPTFDPLIFARELHKEHSSKKLGDVAERLGLTLENAHRATDDAKVAGEVMYAFAPNLPSRLEDLLMLQAQWEAEQETSMGMWRNKRFDDGPSSALEAANVLGVVATGLGPAYLYGEELDPLRAIYLRVPEVSR